VKALLLHPEDSPRSGPWTERSWDLAVDLGKSSASVARAWENQLRCSVLRLESFRHSVEDPRIAGQLLRQWRGRVLDGHGVDWWELTSLLIHAEVEAVLALRRMMPDLAPVTEFYATRMKWPVNALGVLLGRSVSAFCRPTLDTKSGRIGRYRRLVCTLSPAQLVQVFFDKYDADFRWRARWTPQRPSVAQPCVLVPTAYTNVSRSAAAYAKVLPEQPFLFVYTRESGRQFKSLRNIKLVPLASYASVARSKSESTELRQKWVALRRELESVPEFAVLSRLGVLDRFPTWLSDGLAVRDAWLEVLRREPVQAVLCGDDSNWYTRLPVLLGRGRGLPTIGFHHGALDGRFLLKDLSSDIYLAKTRMELDYLTRVCKLPDERIEIGAPHIVESLPQSEHDVHSRDCVVFFSEPYEALGGRPEEVYQELLPRLATLAANAGRRLVIKLHPFESVRAREVLIRRILPEEQQSRIEVVGGPLSPQLMQSAWFGITLESTTVIDCALYGVPCFLAAWMPSSLYGYVQQYAESGVGHLLLSQEELLSIPNLLAKQAEKPKNGLWQPISAERLRMLLTGGQRQEVSERSAEPRRDHV